MMCGRGGMSGPLCSGVWTRAQPGRRWQLLCLCPSSHSPSTARSCCASCTTSGPSASRYLPLHGHPPAQGLCRASCGSGCLRGRCSLLGQCPVLHRLAAACSVWKLPATHDGRSKRQPGLASSQGQTTRSPMSAPMQHGRDVLRMTRQAPAGMCTAMTACPVGCQLFGVI